MFLMFSNVLVYCTNLSEEHVLAAVMPVEMKLANYLHSRHCSVQPRYERQAFKLNVAKHKFPVLPVCNKWETVFLL